MNANTKHTPGPWQVYPLDTRCVIAPNGDVIADIRTCGTSDDTTLIASAPDLLAAIEALLDAHARNSLFSGAGHWEQARTAISRARGEA